MRKIFTIAAAFALVASTSLVLHAEQSMKASSSASSASSATKTVDVPAPVVRENPFVETAKANDAVSATCKSVDSSKSMATEKKQTMKQEMHKIDKGAKNDMHKMDNGMKKMGEDAKSDMHKMDNVNSSS